jgi:hypothetical protein
MKSYKELMVEKTKIRLTDPRRFEALTMILDGASKAAKKEQVEVTRDHLLASVRSLIASMESVIELLKQKDALSENYKLQLEEYKKFLGPQLSEAAIAVSITEGLIAFPPEERTKKNMKNILNVVREIEVLKDADPKVVNRLLAGMLK